MLASIARSQPARPRGQVEPAGRPIEVTVNDGTVSVRDHGPGIDPADLPCVFDHFYCAAAARGLPGAGLGLAIVRQVAEAHGGAVEAANAPGRGGAPAPRAARAALADLLHSS
jgi:signal transduction histidine kinase